MAPIPNQSTRCPICKQPLTQFGQFWMCPQHGQGSPEYKLFVPLRIFLSYGHDNNDELVRRIKADLEKRGHDVWFDQTEINADWRRSITEEIAGSDNFFSFLSKHSTRDRGVCRDEIAIAIGVKGGNNQIILVASEQDLNGAVYWQAVQAGKN